MNNPVRDHVRRGPERSEAEPEPRALVMGAEALGADVTCHICDLPILVGDLYWPVTEWRGRYVAFVHKFCDEGVRR